MRLIYVPQYPVEMRYQSWWFYELPKHFIKYFDEVIVITSNKVIYINSQDDVQNLNISDSTKSESHMFSPIHQAIEYELNQIKVFGQWHNENYKKDDVMFISDISFPGFFFNCLHHYRVKNVYAYCHGTSKNKHDYFQPVRKSKWLTETSHYNLCKKVFVATHYHKNKLKWKNAEVVSLPKSPLIEKFSPSSKEKNVDVLYCGRQTPQKYSRETVLYLKKKGFTVTEKMYDTWQDYFNGISSAKVLLIMGKEDTFNYQIMESMYCNTVCLAPNRCAYPEILNNEYIYYSNEDLLNKVAYYVQHYDKVHTLKVQEQVDRFYQTICNYMIMLS